MISIPNGWYMVRIYMVPPNPKYPPYWSFPEAVYITPYKDVRYKMERIGGTFTVSAPLRDGESGFQIMEYLGENYDKSFRLKEYEARGEVEWSSEPIARCAISQDGLFAPYYRSHSAFLKYLYAITFGKVSTLWDTEMAADLGVIFVTDTGVVITHEQEISDAQKQALLKVRELHTSPVLLDWCLEGLGCTL